MNFWQCAGVSQPLYPRTLSCINIRLTVAADQQLAYAKTIRTTKQLFQILSAYNGIISFVASQGPRAFWEFHVLLDGIDHRLFFRTRLLSAGYTQKGKG